MKKILCFIVYFSILFPQYALAGDKKADPKVVFEKMTVDYKAKENNQDGMMIHLKFAVHNMKDSLAYIAVFFMFNDYHGSALKDSNQQYYSSGGDVALFKDIKPGFDPANYDDLQIFMPYTELDLGPGNYDLAMDTKLIKPDGRVISNLTLYPFNYTEPLPNTSLVPNATVDSVFTEYNIMQNNKTGMRVHIFKLSQTGMKDTDSYLAIYFEKKDRTKLKSITTDYQAQSGQSALFHALKSGYDNAVWEKITLFIPYEEFGLPKGKHELRMDIDAIYKTGTLLKHMRFYEFQVDL
jgi:hypothetical protein